MHYAIGKYIYEKGKQRCIGCSWTVALIFEVFLCDLIVDSSNGGAK